MYRQYASVGLLLSTWVFLLVTGVASHAAVLHVSPTGSDRNPGTAQRPLQTFAAAQRAARQSPGAVVLFHAGTYYLQETIVLTPADSGTTYAAAPGEQVAISGGTKIDLKWEPYQDGIWRARTPGGFTTDQLFVNGERRPMARYPNFDTTGQARFFNGSAADAISPERTARWANPGGGFIHALHQSKWGGMHYLITGKTAAGKLQYEGGWQNNRPSPMSADIRFVENIFEELDAPGEWFLNAEAGLLYLWPPEGVDLAKATIEGVRLRHLVELRGDEAKPVKAIVLRGLTFQHASRTFMDTKEPLLRSDWTIYRGGAVVLSGTEDCVLEDCVVDQIGGNAVFASNYNRRLALRGCHISRAGGSGVAFVGDPVAVRSPLFNAGKSQSFDTIDKEPGPKSSNYPADCLVEDCLIEQTGRVEKQSAGVQIDMAQSITVRHCSIYGVPRAGINIGSGCWGGHIIEFCDVFDTVMETGDHGSFNAWGRDRYWHLGGVPRDSAIDLPRLDVVKPIVLRNSRWRCDHGWDIDLDDGASNYEVRDNLCLGRGIKLREGFCRTVENNLILRGSLHPHVWYGNSHDVFRRNIVAGAYRPVGMKAPWGKEFDYNLLHQPGAPTTRPAAFLQQQSGRDEHSLTADAMFMDPARGDYRVRGDSPALKLGFRDFPMDQFGVQKPALKAIARTPRLTAATQPASSTQPERDVQPATWLGAKIKNVIGIEEVSAAGLPDEGGVRIEELPDQSAAARSGLRENDVILSCAGRATRSLAEFTRAWAAASARGPVKLEIWREQRFQTIEVRSDQ